MSVVNQNAPKVCVVMRSYNDIGLIRSTLSQVLAQDYPNFELWNFDSSSTDGTLDVIREMNTGSRIRLNDSRSYNPGRVLNEAMAATDSEIVVFINSDATPERSDWLSTLIQPMLEDSRIAAVFGRQTSREDCRSLFVKDNERAFGDGSISAKWKHFFSMANSAIRRSVYEELPFETRVQYSEDIDWSWRVKCAGYTVKYVADAPAVHSHNYTLAQSFKRHYGEGVADAWIYRDDLEPAGFVRGVVVSALVEVARDLKWAISSGAFEGCLHSIPLRFTQRYARWRGINDGVVKYAEL